MLKSTRVKMSDWKGEFEKEEKKQYARLTPFQRTLFALIKDGKLKEVIALTEKISIYHLGARDINGFHMVYWANYFGYYSWVKEIYKIKIFTLLNQMPNEISRLR